MISTYRQELIGKLIARDGDCCRYCRIRVRKNFFSDECHPEDATVDHIVPKAKGGTNAFDNLALACRRCNHAKGDRDLDDFLAELNGPSGLLIIRTSRGPISVKSTGQRHMTPWMRRALHDRFPDIYPPPQRERPARIPAPTMTAAETAAWLREKGEAQRMIEAIQERFPVIDVRYGRNGARDF